MAETRPNDLPDMMSGETRYVLFTWAGGAGNNSLTNVSFSSVPGGMTFDDDNISGLEATTFITPSQTGRIKILAEGELASGETIILPAYVNVLDPNCNETSDDYR